MQIFSKYMLYVCVFVYIVHNKYTQYTHIYILCKQKLILDAINRLTTLIK